jgi:hypothetical protein
MVMAVPLTRSPRCGWGVVVVVADIHGEAFGLQRFADKRRRLLFVFNDQHTHWATLGVRFETVKSSGSTNLRPAISPFRTPGF